MKKSDEAADVFDNSEPVAASGTAEDEIPVDHSSDASIPDLAGAKEDSTVQGEADEAPIADPEDMPMAVHEHSPEFIYEGIGDPGVDSGAVADEAHSGEQDSVTDGTEPLSGEDTYLIRNGAVDHGDNSADGSVLHVPNGDEDAADHPTLSDDAVVPAADVPPAGSLDGPSDQVNSVDVKEVRLVKYNVSLVFSVANCFWACDTY